MGEAAERPSTARDRLWRWYLGSVLFLAVLFVPLRGSDRAVAILSVGGITSMLVAIPVGLRLHRPADVRPWYVILAGMAGSVVTNAISYSANTRAATPAYPSVVDVLYVGAYVVVVAGFALFVRAKIARGDRDGFIDALIVTAGLGVLSFVLLIDPYLDDANLSAVARATSMSHPLLELALLGIAARLVFLPGRRPVALWFVCLYAALSFAGDAVYGVQVRAETFSFESGANALWIASFAFFGAGALHPSMRELTERRRGAVSGNGTARLVALGVMAMLGPATLAIGWGHASGHFRQVGAISAAVVALVLGRMWMLTVGLETHRRAQQALRESEERSRRLSDATFEGVIVIADGRIVEANRAFLEMLGLEAEQVVGLAPEELIAPESVPTIYEHLRSGTEEPWEMEVVLRNDRRMWHESRASTIPYGGSEARVISIRDITERRRVDAALRESEQRFRTLFETALDAIVVIDAESTIVQANPAASELVGVSTDRMVGRGFGGLIAPGFDADAARETAHGIEGFRVDIPIVAADGTERKVEATAGLLPDGNLVIVARDVSERRRAEEELRRAEDRYRSLVERLPGAVYVDVPEGGLAGYTSVFISPQAETLHGYAPEEFLADPDLWPRILHPEDRERALEADARHWKTGEPLDQEFRVIAKDGRVVWVRDRAVLLRDDQGRALMSQGFLTDMTDQKEAETLRDARDEAERDNRVRSEFLSRMSHELRTPLNAILGFGQVLESSSLAPEDRDSVERIMEGGRRLLELVDDLLEISRTGGGAGRG